MQVTPLSIEGALVLSPVVHSDNRGSFHEWFRDDVFRKATGHSFNLAQANTSVSTAGTIRGVHFAEVPPGQAKYVSCVSGAIFDVVVDLRVGSPTYGTWEGVLLDTDRNVVMYLGEGLGHAFMALEDNTVVNYLCSAPYSPSREHAVHPIDPSLGIEWPTADRAGKPLAPRLSPKDASAPTLADARASSLLPHITETSAWVTSLRQAAPADH